MCANRIGVMALYAERGIVDEATVYLAQEVKLLVKDLFVIINGNPNKDSIQNISRVTSHVFIRDNKGYDCGAYKYALEYVVGWENLEEYEELILLNDSCYGPIYSLEEVFANMSNKAYDFWGITEQQEIRRNKYSEKMIPYHIQSYFIVVRERMLKSREFRTYWENVKLTDIYELVVENFELTFTKFFNERGFSSGAYIDSGLFCKSKDETRAYVFFDSYRLIAECKCPLLKKKVFLFPEKEILASNAGETARNTIDYIESNTQYDVGFIWKNLIRKCDLFELKSVLHLSYISENSDVTYSLTKHESIIFIECQTNQMLEQSCVYIERLVRDIKVCVLLRGDRNKYSKDIVKHYKEKLNVEVIGDCGFNYSMQNGIFNYKYICIVRESKDISKDEMELLLKNAIYNKNHIGYIQNLFETNCYLGMLMVPQSYIGENFIDGFSNACTNGVWCRTSIFQHVDAQKIEKVDADDWKKGVIQSLKRDGYYIGEVYIQEYAETYLTNYSFILNELIRNVLLPQGVEEVCCLFKINMELIDFAQKYSKIYVYGAGKYGEKCLEYLEENNINVDGVIVSNGMKFEEYFQQYRIYEISELKLEDDIGIIIALNQKNTEVVKKLIEINGFENTIEFSKC